MSSNYTYDVLIPSVSVSSILLFNLNALTRLFPPPNTIFVVLPPSYLIDPTILSDLDPSIVFLNSDQKYQVNQRNFGFSYVNSEYCLCIDEDTYINQSTLDTILSCYTTVSMISDKACVSPLKYRALTFPDLSYAHIVNRKNVNLLSTFNFFHHFLYGSSPCFSFDRFGLPFSLFSSYFYDKEFYRVEWLRGGFRFMKSTLLQPSGYPFPGKALFEDIWGCLESSRTIDYFAVTEATHYELVLPPVSISLFRRFLNFFISFHRFLILSLVFRRFTFMLIPRFFISHFPWRRS